MMTHTREGVTRKPTTLARVRSNASLDTTLLHDCPQIPRTRHGLHGTHVRSARVSERHPDARKQGCGDDSSALAKYFPPLAHRNAQLQHEPMHANMLPRVTLAEDMCALEVMK